jgi:hypothetical protein
LLRLVLPYTGAKRISGGHPSISSSTLPSLLPTSSPPSEESPSIENWRQS